MFSMICAPYFEIKSVSSDLSDDTLLEILKESKIVMGCFEFGLTCELEFKDILSNGFLEFAPLDDPYSISGYVSGSGIEIVFVHDSFIYLRKLLNDDDLYRDENVIYTSPIIFDTNTNTDTDTNYVAYIESIFDGFDGIDVKLMFSLEWFKSLNQSDANLLVKF